MKAIKIHILLFLFFDSNCFALEFKAVKVPAFMSGVKKDTIQTGDYYNYPGGVYLGKEPDSKSSDQVERFIAKLWNMYKSDDFKSFKALFTNKGRVKLNSLGDDVIKREWKVIANQDRAFVDSYFELNGGLVASWKADEIPRGLFLIKEGDALKIEAFEAASENVQFHNRSLYFTYLPKKEEKAKVIKKFNLSDKEYNLVVKLNQPYLHLFKKENGRWEPKVVIKDNDVGKGRFDDEDPRAGFVSLSFNRDHFTQGVEHEVLVLQSNFPMSYYPLTLIKKGNLFLKK